MKVAPSLLSANWAFLARDIAEVEKAGADLLHIDVMDGHFVKALTMGPKFVRDIKQITKLPLDVHLMVDNPDQQIDAFLKAGADRLSFHVELAYLDIIPLLQTIRDAGCKSGLAINPSTPASSLNKYLEYLDFVLVMTVNPGRAGQAFMPEVLPRISEIKAMGVQDVTVDGGVDSMTIVEIKNSGADSVVSGSYIFGCDDRASAIRSLKV